MEGEALPSRKGMGSERKPETRAAAARFIVTHRRPRAVTGDLGLPGLYKMCEFVRDGGGAADASCARKGPRRIVADLPELTT